jgi:hypothetical protein
MPRLSFSFTFSGFITDDLLSFSPLSVTIRLFSLPLFSFSMPISPASSFHAFDIFPLSLAGYFRFLALLTLCRSTPACMRCQRFRRFCCPLCRQIFDYFLRFAIFMLRHVFVIAADITLITIRHISLADFLLTFSRRPRHIDTVSRYHFQPPADFITL